MIFFSFMIHIVHISIITNQHDNSTRTDYTNTLTISPTYQHKMHYYKVSLTGADVKRKARVRARGQARFQQQSTRPFTAPAQRALRIFYERFRLYYVRLIRNYIDTKYSYFTNEIFLHL